MNTTAKTILIVLGCVAAWALMWTIIMLPAALDDISDDKTEKPAETKKPALSEWHYYDKLDVMNDVVSYFAESKSIVKMTKGGDAEYLTIYIRKRGKELDAILSLEQNQFFGLESQKENYVLVRDGLKKSQKYYYDESKGVDTRTIFLRNPKKFIEQLKKAKTAMIEVPIFRQPRAIFDYEFGDSTLVWK